MSSASVVPVLDFSLVHTPKGRQAFLDSMLAALRDVGLFYLKNHPVQASLFEEARQECDAFFSLPDVDKAEIDIANVPSFLGYTKLGSEVTANRTDWREHLTISTPHPAPTGGPAYLNLLAPNQWPSPDRLPHFRTVYEQWIEQVSDVSNTMRNLVSEAMGIDPELVSRFFQNQQHRLRLMKYPEIPTSQATDKEQVGLGAHRDKGFSTLIFQASPHRCLQVQTREGVWIDAPPLDNTFVFIAGQALEAMTHGICRAPWHRVVTPPPGLGPRYSIAVGTGIGMDTAVAAKETQEALNTLRDDILQRFPDARDEFRTFLAGTRDGESVGTQYLAQYLASHPDIATRWLTDATLEIATYDLEAIHSIVNVAPVLHVSLTDPSEPFPVTLPMIGHMGDFHHPSSGLDEPLDIYMHGYVSSRLMNEARSAAASSPDGGLPVSICATMVDGIVLTLTPNSHNYNYRSAVIQGYARPVDDEEERLYAMELITNSVVTDRWRHSRVPPDNAEMQSTTILRVKVVSASGKIRDGGVTDLKKDYENEEVTARVWTGVIPIWQTMGEPVPSEGNQVAPVPEHVTSYIRRRNEESERYAKHAVTVPLPKEEIH